VSRILVVSEAGVATHGVASGERVAVGRDPTCAVPIRERDVSRIHAWLTGGEPAQIENPGATNGVRVRGKTLGPGEASVLDLGDIVEIGDAVLVLCSDEGPIARAAPDTASMPRARSGPTELDRFASAVARTDLGILVLGEPGTGKTHFAESIHARSACAAGPYATVECTTPGETVLVQELFENGGALAAAAGGTLILDEVGELPLAIQDRLIEANANVRWVATSRIDLAAACAAGSFRRALYDRIAGVRIVLAPLVERRGEIPRLAARFVASAAAQEGRPPPRISTDALAVLVRHSFPGNLRELRQTMERALHLAGPRFIGPEHLVLEAPGKPREPTPRFLAPRHTEPTEAPASTLGPMIEIPRAPKAPHIDDEGARIVRALEAAAGNTAKAAAALGISRQKLAARMKDLAIARPKKERP
jgi:two-component system, NtrC family, response regulator AtoC